MTEVIASAILIELQPQTVYSGKHRFCGKVLSMRGTLLEINIAEKPGFFFPENKQMYSIGPHIEMGKLFPAQEHVKCFCDEVIITSPFGNFRIRKQRYHSSLMMGVNWYKSYILEPITDDQLADYTVATVTVPEMLVEPAADPEADAPVDDIRVGMMISSHLSDIQTGHLATPEILNRTNFIKWLLLKHPDTRTWVNSEAEWKQFTQTQYFNV